MEYFGLRVMEYLLKYLTKLLCKVKVEKEKHFTYFLSSLTFMSEHSEPTEETEKTA